MRRPRTVLETPWEHGPERQEGDKSLHRRIGRCQGFHAAPEPYVRLIRSRYTLTVLSAYAPYKQVSDLLGKGALRLCR